jgi:hypothetical protein
VQDHTLTELDSGVRVVTESVPSVRSIAIGLWVKVGSRDERDEEAGISHFLEHLLFKGTPRLSAEQIAQVFDGFGADVNAATSKETTVLYAHFLDEHLEEAFAVMGDMLLRSTYAEMDSEREVVLEEIAMYEDEPSDKVHDVLSAAIFGEHPLGRPVIGRRDVISSLTLEEVASYHGSRYTPTSIVIAAAGNLEHGTSAPRPFRRRTPSSTTSASAAPGSSATTTVASRSRCSTRCSVARRRRDSSRRSGRSAGSRIRSTRGRATTGTPDSSASTSARVETTWARRWK